MTSTLSTSSSTLSNDTVLETTPRLLEDTSATTSPSTTSSTSLSTSSPQEEQSIRKRQRELVANPPKRAKRRTKNADLQAVAKTVAPMLAALDRKIRWMALLYCTNTQHAAIIREAYGKDASTDSYEWIVARTKVFENIKSYKNKTIGRMLAHVREMRLIDIEKGGMMAGVKDEKLLHDYFCAKYNTENFLSVWGFMDGYLDVENSSELGAYFLKNVYSNFATRLLVAGGPGQADSRKELLEFYDTMTTKSEYDAVDKSCFAAFDEKGMKQKDSKKKVRKLLPANDTRYHVSGPPPPKAAPSPPPPVASL